MNPFFTVNHLTDANLTRALRNNESETVFIVSVFDSDSEGNLSQVFFQMDYNGSDYPLTWVVPMGSEWEAEWLRYVGRINPLTLDSPVGNEVLTADGASLDEDAVKMRVPLG